MVRDEKSERRKVTSRVHQGLVLAQIMFFIYISYISLFTYDAKLQRQANEIKDCEELQNYSNIICTGEKHMNRAFEDIYWMLRNYSLLLG